MPNVLNHTSFSVEVFGILDQHAKQYDVVVVSAAFEARPGQPIALCDEQPPVRINDEYHGDPACSSVRFEGETAWGKPFVDVIAIGNAYAPHDKKAESVMVSLLVGDVHKALRVSGDRYWRPRRLGGRPSAPEPFETMPITYERAFGGIDIRSSDPAKHYSDPRNPIGVGFRGAPSQNPEMTTEVPNVEYPGQLLKSRSSRPDPAGLGVIGRNWQPRIGLAGTYDSAWQAEQWPLLPLDFNECHFQSAPHDQQSATIQGGDAVEVLNMTPEGRWEFALPTLDIPLRLCFRDRAADGPSLRLDTVLLEPTLYRVTLLARTKIPVVRNRAPLDELILGHVTSGWWRARLKNKRYLDWSGWQGRSPGVEHYRL